jgi:hypothetical protein
MDAGFGTDHRRLDSGPVAGRLVLLFGAYAPVGLIVGARAIPSCPGWIAVGVGVTGLLTWLAFLYWLPHRQTRDADAEDVELVDSEVTGYIVSILLPLVAAGEPSAGDLVAYAFCACLVLFVAYVSNLAAVNPFIYLFGFRVVRATIDGESTIALVYDPHDSEGEVVVVQAIGVTLILGKAPATGEA